MSATPLSLLEQLRGCADGSSWQRFAEIYEPWLRQQFRRQGLQSADVDDLVQEVMAILVKEVPRFEHSGRPGAFRSWLRGVVANRLRELWRERRHRPGSEGDFTQQLADDRSDLSRRWDREHDQHVVGMMLRRIAAEFEPRTWQTFQAFVLEGRKAAEVALALGMSEGAVWTAKSHVLKRLRQLARGWLD